MTSDADRALYTVKEFCRRNSIGKTTFYELVKEGKIHTVHVYTRTLVPAESERLWHASLQPKNLPPNPTKDPTNERRIAAKKRERVRTTSPHKIAVNQHLPNAGGRP